MPVAVSDPASGTRTAENIAVSFYHLPKCVCLNSS
jgi:hypothetical protein